MAHDDGLERFLGWRQVRELTGLGRTTTWRLRQAGDFPEPVAISPGRVAWRARDIAAWNATREAAMPMPDPVARPLKPAPTRPRERRVVAVPPAKPNPPPPSQSAKPTPRPRRRSGPILAKGQLGFDF
ncbi:AlpA family phage regulatory protein [Brevundimonas sp.]|jgi:prophage regulatory protein|uniref:helix-turn-helix transcriptional regulator n=1 Tax=Brevundimonas sp. TaxID=1871086 RepID=UPI0028AD39D0|nr:AlpA family phage regulatory protein [Brevundimonas sp.]